MGKKIRGKLHYFGPWSNWPDALTPYQKQAGDLHAGRKPHEHAEGLTVQDLVDRFLASKRHMVDNLAVGSIWRCRPSYFSHVLLRQFIEFQ